MKVKLLKKLFAVVLGMVAAEFVQKRAEKIMKVDDVKFGFGITF